MNVPIPDLPASKPKAPLPGEIKRGLAGVILKVLI